MKNSSYVWRDEFDDSHCMGHNADGKVTGIPKTDNSNAAASLSTTIEDMTLFYEALLKKHNLSSAAFDEMLKPQIKIVQKQQFGPNANIDTNENDSINLSYGLGFGIYFTSYGKAFFREGHADGWQHYSVGFPDQGLALIIMANSEHAESIFKELIELTTANDKTL